MYVYFIIMFAGYLLYISVGRFSVQNDKYNNRFISLNSAKYIARAFYMFLYSYNMTQIIIVRKIWKKNLRLEVTLKLHNIKKKQFKKKFYFITCSE